MKKIAYAVALIALSACSAKMGDGSRLQPTGQRNPIKQGIQFCNDHPADPQCSR